MIWEPVLAFIRSAAIACVVLDGILPLSDFSRAAAENPLVRATEDEMAQILRYIREEEEEPCFDLTETSLGLCLCAWDLSLPEAEDTRRLILETPGDFFLPSLREIEDLTEHGYLREREESIRFRLLLRELKGFPEDRADEITRDIWQYLTTRLDPFEVMDGIADRYRLAPMKSMEDMDRFMTGLMAFAASVPNIYAHGHPHPSLAPFRARTSSMFTGAGRNDPCPCGSGRKYKNCHGRSR